MSETTPITRNLYRLQRAGLLVGLGAVTLAHALVR